MTLLIVGLIWLLAVGLILLFFGAATKNNYVHPIEEMILNDYQESPPVMWDEIPYNAN